jgi:hypothetical protein
MRSLSHASALSANEQHKRLWNKGATTIALAPAQPTTWSTAPLPIIQRNLRMAGNGDGLGLIARHGRSMVGFVWKSTELNAGTSALRRSNTILRVDAVNHCVLQNSFCP